MKISVHSKGDFKKTEKLLKKSFGKDYRSILERYAKQGVEALSKNTPVDTGQTAASWYYEIVQNGSNFSIQWKNSNIQNGMVIALLLQYGHGTRGGGYVEGRDYINPALRPIFDKMAEAAWKEITTV